MTLPLSNRCRVTDDRESELEAPHRNLTLLSRLLTVARKPHQPGGVPPRSCIAPNLSRTRSPRGPSDPAGSIIKRQKGNSINNREQTDHTAAVRQRPKRSVQRSAISPLLGGRGLQISQGVYVHVLNERVEEEIEEEAGRGPSSPQTNSMAGRVRVCKEGPPFSQRAEKMQRPVSQSKFRRGPRNRHDQREQ